MNSNDFINTIKSTPLDSVDGNPFPAEQYDDDIKVFAAMFGSHLGNLMEYDHEELARSGLKIVDNFLLNGDEEIQNAIREWCLDSLIFSRSCKNLMGEMSPDFRVAFIEKKKNAGNK